MHYTNLHIDIDIACVHRQHIKTGYVHHCWRERSATNSRGGVAFTVRGWHNSVLTCCRTSITRTPANLPSRVPVRVHARHPAATRCRRKPSQPRIVRWVYFHRPGQTRPTRQPTRPIQTNFQVYLWTYDPNQSILTPTPHTLNNNRPAVRMKLQTAKLNLVKQKFPTHFRPNPTQPADNSEPTSERYSFDSRKSILKICAHFEKNFQNCTIPCVVPLLPSA